MPEEDPFRHHPGLRDLIADPTQSFFRDFRPSSLDGMAAAHGLPDGWRRTEADIEAARGAFLDGHDGDLWIFAYGSLMWDPAIDFCELRKARVEAYARKCCLVDTLGGRGTPQQPGIMVALADGAHCDGLAFRISGETLDRDTRRIWNREMLAPAYHPTKVPAQTDFGGIEAVAFVADPGAAMIQLDLPRADQVHYIATGTGFLGSSLDGIRSMAAHFSELGTRNSELRMRRWPVCWRTHWRMPPRNKGIQDRWWTLLSAG